jgi:hypothetical protein
MVVVVFAINMSGTFLIGSKLDWIVLAYAAASGDLVVDRRSRWPAARVDGASDKLAGPIASPGLRDGPKRLNSLPAGAEPEQTL